MFPVEEKIEEIKAALRENHNVVLVAPPGSGKTTCVPTQLIGEEFLGTKKIVMLEPRRLAAKNCASFIARKLGENVGETVGYQVRLEKKISDITKLEILTEGLLTARILNDMELSDVGLVVFDEFHERSLSCDLAYALTLEIRRALRPDLRILVMSATLDSESVAEHMGDARVIKSDGRMFNVTTKYLGEKSIPFAVSLALKETAGDVLVFLPGEGEIRRAEEACMHLPCKVLPLFGALPKEEQDKVFEKSIERKVILSTSIAETSLTIEGVTAVVDSGLMRVPRFNASTGMSGLETLPLSRDRAEQRAGRAGRVCEGISYRLWNQEENASRPIKMSPEILDNDLTSLVLTCKAWGANKKEDMPWMTMPPASSWAYSENLLKLLGALSDNGRLTPKGLKMSKMPMHPRLANMLLEGGEPILAAIIEEGGRTKETDIRYTEINSRVRELSKRFARFRSPGVKASSEGDSLSNAYPDRICKNRGDGSFRMVSGKGAYLPSDDPLSKEPYLVACELDSRQGDARIFLAAPIRESEIISRFGSLFKESVICQWDKRADRVKSVRRLSLGAMPVSEKPIANCDTEFSAKIADALLDGIRHKGVENLPCWSKSAISMRERINFIHKHDNSWPEITDEVILENLSGFLSGISKWKDLEKVDLSGVMNYILSEKGIDGRELDRLAPTRMEVPSGSHMTIHYDGDLPTVEVRLQECFGLMETPKVLRGSVPIVMTLLSPAHRPIQITKDLKLFWQDSYNLVRKDMRGRYPKHYWPEDPFNAIATSRVRPKL